VFTLRMQQSEQELTNMILGDIADNINHALDFGASAVKDKIKDKIAELIWASPEIESLISGQLSKELGLANAEPIVVDIIAKIQQAMQFTIEHVNSYNGRLVGGGYIIEVLRGDFSEVLSIPDAAYTTTNNVLIPWLNWLLFAGDSPLIYGYKVVLNPNNAQNSRTGAVMVKSGAGAWTIPQQNAGTLDNNFLTRALANLGDEIEKIVSEEIIQRI
jgi:hypothetical protein